MKSFRHPVLLQLSSGLLLFALPVPELWFIAVLLLHVFGGLILAALLGAAVRRLHAWPDRAVALGLGLAAASGVALLATGALRSFEWLVHLHAAVALAATVAVLLAASPARAPRRMVNAGAIVVLAFLAWNVRHRGRDGDVILNPPMPPEAMAGEGDGPGSPFFPSPARVSAGGSIRASQIMTDQACARCHADIHAQWSSSAHRFSSFNNQWYKRSIEYMQEVQDVGSTKWCAGCHDPALLLSGQFEKRVGELEDKPEAHAGLTCVMCHSISKVGSTMGQGEYTLDVSPLADLAASGSAVARRVHDVAVRLNPEPHRRAFMKPFVREQSSEFCSTCHKVHLDVPVNGYRWIRGFNDYDNWQASGVSGLGARSFYYPPQPQQCVDCHMPSVPSEDAGHRGGMVRSHRFPAANTALPTANNDRAQLEAVEKFLKGNVVSVDIFAMSAAQPSTATQEGGSGPQLSTQFAVGEEAETAIQGQVIDGAPVTAPLDAVGATVRRGDELRLDVVVRTRRVGHFFPGGTVDAFDVWLELKAIDDLGQVIFWNGRVEDDGRGPVDRSAHFYRSLSIDSRGRPINKRNAFESRALVYARLIPPGAADTAHFRLKVPDSTGSRIRIEARLHYRKFAWSYTQFSFETARDRPVPDLPIVTMAEDQVDLGVLPASATRPEPLVSIRENDWTRWNDYGIGLLLQGDLRGAESAFRRVTEAAPSNPDGWVNIGRARVQEGNLPGAREVLERALTLKPGLPRAEYFYARVLKAEGRHDEAIERLKRALTVFPKDRVVQNELGRNLFLQRKYDDAIREFQQVLSVDPEDLQAHYNLMLCYTGLGKAELAGEHEKRYLRFKADESAQSLVGAYLRENPLDNNERQPIHEHVSAPLTKGRR